MSFDKAIKHKKEKRKRYYGSKSFDASCRTGGTCPYCIENRQYKNKKRLESAKLKFIEAVDKAKQSNNSGR